MVNEWSPDPPQNHCDAEIGPVGSSTFTVIGGSSSDSENDEVVDNGYELLPMTPTEDLEGTSDTEDENDYVQQTLQQPCNAEGSNRADSPNSAGQTDSLESPDAEASPERSQEMDPELMDKIKAAMSGFSLPLAAVPRWAFHVPEEEWHSHLVERMQNLQERGGRPPPPASQSDTNTNSK
ncbi:uncharacterized protein [Hetaerina americana]|uniref:uncharacterized protein n=1 Tax=Hetaerina americana TaxID=62018 RepID=UPI003A7F1747